MTVYRNAPEAAQSAITVSDFNFWYGDFHALTDVNLNIAKNKITAFIGPSGCGKSTFLRCMNRMNDLIEGTHIEGTMQLDGSDIYAEGVDPVDLRRRVGMIFQQPNPFPKSIYENVAFGPRLQGVTSKSDLDDIVEESLKRANLWKEVSNQLSKDGLALSGGQQQRLCIARVLAVQPDVLLMDEPCSAIDPTSVQKVEDLMVELAPEMTIIIVTHNMQQAARISAHRILPAGGRRRARHAHRVRPDQRHLHHAHGQAHRGLHHRSLRLMCRNGRRAICAARTRIC